MTIINEKVVELSVESSNTKNSSGNCWEGGNEMMVGACFLMMLFPPSIISGGFSPIGRKVLIVTMGTATTGVSTGLRAYVYGRIGMEYRNVFP